MAKFRTPRSHVTNHRCGVGIDSSGRNIRLLQFLVGWNLGQVDEVINVNPVTLDSDFGIVIHAEIAHGVSRSQAAHAKQQKERKKSEGSLTGHVHWNLPSIRLAHRSSQVAASRCKRRPDGIDLESLFQFRLRLLLLSKRFRNHPRVKQKH